MKRVYRSKIDTWVLLLMILAMGAIAAAMWNVVSVSGASLWRVDLAIGGLALLLLLSILICTRYTLVGDHLLVRSGPFLWRIALSEITAIVATRNPIASPALSLDRLRINYGPRSLSISPSDTEQFLRDINAALGANVL